MDLLEAETEVARTNSTGKALRAIKIGSSTWVTRSKPPLVDGRKVKQQTSAVIRMFSSYVYNSVKLLSIVAGKDVFWYTREKEQEQAEKARLELQAIKQREEDLMNEVSKEQG